MAAVQQYPPPKLARCRPARGRTAVAHPWNAGHHARESGAADRSRHRRSSSGWGAPAGGRVLDLMALN